METWINAIAVTGWARVQPAVDALANGRCPHLRFLLGGLGGRENARLNGIDVMRALQVIAFGAQVRDSCYQAQGQFALRCHAPLLHLWIPETLVHRRDGTEVSDGAAVITDRGKALLLEVRCPRHDIGEGVVA